MNFKPWLESTEEQYSNEMTERLCSWVKLHGRKPRTGSGPILSGSPTAGSRVSYNMDLEEHKLGEFLKDKIRSGQIYPSDQAILQRHQMEGLFENRRRGDKRAISLKNVEKLAEFYKKNGRYPFKRADRANPEAVYLAGWLGGKRQARKGVGMVKVYDGERELGISLGLPEDWLDQGNEERNRTNMQRLAEYYRRNGHLPRKTDTDPEARSLFGWLQGKRRARRGIKGRRLYDGERELGISLGLPEDWIDFSREELNLSKDRLFLQKVVEYHKKNGYYPRITDPDPEVVFLGRWLSRKRQARKGVKGRLYDGERELGISLGLPDDWLEDQKSKSY